MSNNRAWKIESFIDSLTVELDKVRETLAIKAINKPLTYSVKDVSMDLQIFPEFDGDDVRFTTAKAGQEGASKLSLQLGSITDRQIRETSKIPSKADVSIESIEEIDDETKKDLKKIGINTYEDFKKTQDKIDLDQVKSTDSGKKDYKKLASLLEKARRGTSQPRIAKISLSQDNKTIEIEGDNLSLTKEYLPKASINEKETPVVFADKYRISLQLNKENLKENNEILVAFDPYAIYRLNLKK